MDVSNIDNNSIKDFIELIKDLLNKDNYSSLEILNIIDTISEKLEPIYSNIINYVLNDALTNKEGIIAFIKFNSINL